MKKILFIVDCQKIFINVRTQPVADKIVDFVKHNLQNYKYVFISQFRNNADSNFVKMLNYTSGLAQGPSRGKDTIYEPLFLISKKFLRHEKFQWLLPESTYNKYHKMVFDMTGYDVDVCGFDIDGCVLATCFELFDNGIQFSILKSLTTSSSNDENMNQYAWKIMERSFGKKVWR